MNTETIENPAANAAEKNPLAAIATLVAPRTEELMRPATTSRATAEMITVTNDQDREFAVEEIQSIKAAAKRLEERRTSITGPLTATMRAVNALFAPASSALEAAEKLLKDKVLTYDREQERIAAEARRAAEARARAEQEAARVAAAALAQKAEEEARAQREAADAAAAAGNQEQATILDIQAAATQQAASEAAAEVQRVAYQAPTIAVSAPVKTGTSTRAKWTAELVDFLKLVQHVAQHPEHLGLLEFNQSAANKLASALQSNTNVPGMRVNSDSVLAVRAKKAA